MTQHSSIKEKTVPDRRTAALETAAALVGGLTAAAAAADSTAAAAAAITSADRGLEVMMGGRRWGQQEARWGLDGEGGRERAGKPAPGGGSD